MYLRLLLPRYRDTGNRITRTPSIISSHGLPGSLSPMKSTSSPRIARLSASRRGRASEVYWVSATIRICFLLFIIFHRQLSSLVFFFFSQCRFLFSASRILFFLYVRYPELSKYRNSSIVNLWYSRTGEPPFL